MSLKRSPPKMRVVRKGWFTDKEIQVPAEVLEDEDRKVG